MDGSRFDDLLRSLSASPTRRGIGQTLVGLTLAGPLGVFMAQREADAKKKHKKHKHKHKKKKCRPKCTGKTCGDDGCGGTCGTCSGSDDCCAGQCMPPVYCGGELTCGCDQVCKAIGGTFTCQDGGCPVTDFCNDSETFTCSDDPSCVCSTSIDGVNGCFNIPAATCQTCGSDADCTAALGTPALCLPPGDFCCGASTTCAPLCAD